MPPKGKQAGGKKGKDASKSGTPDAGNEELHDTEPEQAESEAVVVSSGVADWEPTKELVKPDDQLRDLTEKELNKEFEKSLTANNPQAPKNIARFNHKEKSYKNEPSVDQLSVHMELEGYLLHTESDDAKRQKAAEEAEKEAMHKEHERRKNDGDNAEDDAKGLRNQFNFSERASQTLNNPLKDRSTITEPPPSVEYAAQSTQWEIYDAYMEDQERQKQAKDKHKTKEKKQSDKSNTSDDKGQDKGEEDVIHSASMGHSVKILERMLNQNTFDDVTQDYKFWEDQSDLYREGEGTLLPLWRFSNDKAKRKQVTGIKWNHEFDDLFVVTYGSYDFMKQGSGLLSLYTLKNPSFPEFSATSDSGMMCVDWHPQHSSVLAVGMYDGTVCVYDVRQKSTTPIFKSTVQTGKHTDPVWEVRWQEEDLAKNLAFISISSDGRVTQWTLSKNELEYSDVMELKLLSSKEADPEEETNLVGLAGGCCFDFNKFSEHLFVVGTEEGKIHKCSKAYNSSYLETYEGHNMAVYTVQWNHFHQKCFISCSADWTVKLWDHNVNTPLMSFDLNNQVGDVAWTPWSSTTFAACTSDGKVHVFDLNENKHEPMCDQKVVRKSKLTKLCFNKKEPVLLVGDDHGCISCLKLSPNLRWTADSKTKEMERRAKEAEEAASGGGRPQRGAPKKEETKKEPENNAFNLEVQKLDKILEVAMKAESTA